MYAWRCKEYRKKNAFTRLSAKVPTSGDSNFEPVHTSAAHRSNSGSIGNDRVHGGGF